MKDMLSNRDEIAAWRVPASVLAQVSDAVVVTDTENRVVFWNRSAERLYGISAAQILGRPRDEAYRCIWTGPMTEQAVHQALSAHGLWEGQAVHLTADGRQLHVHSAVRILTDGGATSTVAFNRCEDTSRIRGERLELLSRAAAHLLGARDPDAMVRELFEKVSAHLNVHAYFNFMVNDTGDALRLDSYTGIPERTARLIQTLDFGQAVCGTVAQTRQMIHATDVQHSADPKVELIRRYGIRAYCCNPLLAGDRLIGTLSFGSRAVDRFEDDDVEFMRTICHYVAIAKERLRLENDLRARIRQLAEADRRKDEFLAMLSHELRNPLAAVASALDLLRAGGAQPPGILERTLDAATRQARHMSHLLDDLLDVSRVTRGKITLKKECVTLRSVIESAVEAINPVVRERGHSLGVCISPEPMLVNGDPVRLTQAVSNLLNNAAKYTEAAGEIHVSAAVERGQGTIRVRDNGAGIEPDLLPCIFDTFVQGDRSPDRAQGGLGIGLTLARSLIEMHGGRIEAHSKGPGTGSEFLVRLPLAAMKPAGTEIDGKEEKSIAPLKIMVVDDNTDAATMIAALLQLDGHDVTAAHTGAAAIELALEHRPDLALLDIGMPGMDGFELARRLREIPALARMVLVAVTGYGRDEDFQHSRSAGFHHHLIKPVELHSLRQVLQQVSSMRPAAWRNSE